MFSVSRILAPYVDTSGINFYLFIYLLTLFNVDYNAPAAYALIKIEYPHPVPYSIIKM